VNAANDDGFPLSLIKVFNEQQKELYTNKSKIKALLNEKNLDIVVASLKVIHTLIMHEDKIYVPESLCGHMIEWYH
jgi:hypothetical protein